MAAADFNPFSLIQGFEFGQKAQRDEEKALEEIERQRLLNQFLGTRVGEFQSPQQTETRRLQDLLQQVNAQLGVDLGGIQQEALASQRADVLSGVEAGMQGRSAQARLGRDEAVFRERELAPLERMIRGTIAESDVAALPETMQTRRAQTQLVGRTQQEQLAQLAARDAERAAAVALSRTDPNLPLLDRITQVYAAAPEEQKSVLAPLIQRAKVAEAASIQEMMGLNRYLSRTGRQGRILEDGTVETFQIVADSQGNPSVGAIARFKDLDEWRASEGVQVERPRTTAAGTRPAAEPKGSVGARAGAALGISPAPAGAARAAATPTVNQALTQATQAAMSGANPQPAVPPAAPVAAPAVAARSPTTPSMDELRVMIRDAARGGAVGTQYLQSIPDLSSLGLTARDRLEIQRMLDAIARR